MQCIYPVPDQPIPEIFTYILRSYRYLDIKNMYIGMGLIVLMQRSEFSSPLVCRFKKERFVTALFTKLFVILKTEAVKLFHVIPLALVWY